MDVWGLITLAVVLIVCVMAIAAAVRVLLRAARMRSTPSAGLERAGEPTGTDDPKAAFDRAEGKAAWTRISGGGF